MHQPRSKDERRPLFPGRCIFKRCCFLGPPRPFGDGNQLGGGGPGLDVNKLAIIIVVVSVHPAAFLAALLRKEMPQPFFLRVLLSSEFLLLCQFSWVVRELRSKEVFGLRFFGSAIEDRLKWTLDGLSKEELRRNNAFPSKKSRHMADVDSRPIKQSGQCRKSLPISSP